MADPGMNGEVAPEDRELRALLGDAHTIAVVGLSSKPDRPSFGVAAYLQEHGYRIVPVNPNETEVFGEPAYPTLGDIPAYDELKKAVVAKSKALKQTAKEAI